MGTGRHDIWRVAVRCVWRALSSKSSSAAAHLARRAYSSAAAQEPPQQQRWPVIIVGAGPTGLALALWLGRYGAPSHVACRPLQLHRRSLIAPTEACFHRRRAEPGAGAQRARHDAPAGALHQQPHHGGELCGHLASGLLAHGHAAPPARLPASCCFLGLPQVLRPLQGLAAEVAAQSPPLDHWRSFRYGFSMLGELLGEVDHFAGLDPWDGRELNCTANATNNTCLAPHRRGGASRRWLAAPSSCALQARAPRTTRPFRPSPSRTCPRAACCRSCCAAWPRPAAPPRCCGATA